MYEAARLLFKNIHNNAKLALCLVHLGQYREAVEAATKANAVNTWKQAREKNKNKKRGERIRKKKKRKKKINEYNIYIYICELLSACSGSSFGDQKLGDQTSW